LPESQRPSRFGVIDIGSNSVRLVVYDRVARIPTVLFNEKVLCGLGRGLTATGKLADAGIAMALHNIARFVTLTREMEVGGLEVIATAAVRDAINGADFVEMTERRCGIKVRVASGSEEAALAARGVQSAIPEADGVIGDLGGGSLELIRVAPGELGDHATLPLGPLRLAAWNNRRPANSGERVDGHLKGLAWLQEARGRTLYAVGGSWRAIARLHMARIHHPLRVLHRFTVPFEEAVEMTAFIARKRGKHLAGLANVGKERLELTPLAAFVLERLLRVMQPKALTFSALGLREGVVYSRLDEHERALDPLLEECRDIGASRCRFQGFAEPLADWVAPLFPDEGPGEARLRYAVALLADIAWREHPDYRADQAFLEILRLPLLGADHATRAALALALYYRYTGKDSAKRTAIAESLVTPEVVRRMKILGQAVRLGLTLSGGQARMLAPLALRLESDALTLAVPSPQSELVGEVVVRRLAALAQVLGKPHRVLPIEGAG